MDAGNTVFYIVATIIIAHFVVGFIFLVRKLSGPVPDEGTKITEAEQAEAEEKPI